ncbi:MAG: glycosyltransferase family 4 protein [Actinobacteria bacterium]|nr:MAG: glycosyltransferase family 4 protein [Actinomycetota bacterium]
MRLAVYTDYVYRREGDAVYAERAFALFLAELASHVERLVIVGRLDPRSGASHYRLPDTVEFVPLPHYPSLVDARRSVPAMVRSLARFWRVLREADTVWLLGPYALSVLFALMAAMRGRRVALGVRQDTLEYVRSRHPGRRWVHAAARLLDAVYRRLARRFPVVVVGPELARHYERAPRVLPITVSLVRDDQIASPAEAADRSYDGELVALSVGRLEREKNPLLLADILARLRERDPRWRLVVAGEGPLEPALRERLREFGVEEAADVRGYVPIDGGLPELYRSSHAFLHVSWTEGLPQVLFEAFAAALPVVATEVGGVPAAAEGAALLVPPGDPERPAEDLARLGRDPELRARLVAAGLDRVREHTLEAEVGRVAEFLAE